MSVDQILEAIFQDGQKHQNFGSTSHLPDTPEIDADLKAEDLTVTDKLMVDQTNWEDYSRYPVEVWQRLKRDAFAAGTQGRNAYNQAKDFLGHSDPASFDTDLEYIKRWL